MNIPDSFRSLLGPDLRRYIALKQLLGRLFRHFIQSVF
jgi:hypothetical protein